MIRTARRFAVLPVALAFGAASVLGACGADDPEDVADTSSTSEVDSPTAGSDVDTADEPEATGGDQLAIVGGWARTSPAMTTAGAVYMVIENPTDVDDALVGASVDPAIAGTVEVHQTSMAPAEEDGMAGGGMDEGTEGSSSGGMMTMEPVDEVPVPAGGSAVLEPGGYHVMLLDMPEPLTAGETIEVTLTFASAGEVAVEVEVRDDAP